jgi:SAM-dependent methyltransferase
VNLRETYNRIAAEWHRDHQKDDWWVTGTEKFLSLLPKSGSILDVGCGGGTKARYLVDRGFKVTGIDFSEKMVEISRREVPTGRFFAMDLHDLGGGLAQTFDGVFAQAVLLHVPKSEIRNTLSLFQDKTAPGGYLYIAVKEIRPDQSEEEVRIEDDYGYEYERFFSYFTLPELETHFATLGIEVVWSEVTPSGKSRWIQLIGRKTK